jgi:anti-sigma B factor antagonist
VSVLTLTVQEHPAGLTLIRVAGDLDYDTGHHLRQALDQLPSTRGPGVILELSGLTYCDSTGISLLVTAHQRTQAARTPLALTGLDANLKRMLRIVGLDRLFTFYDTADAAVAAFLR